MSISITDVTPGGPDSRMFKGLSGDRWAEKTIQISGIALGANTIDLSSVMGPASSVTALSTRSSFLTETSAPSGQSIFLTLLAGGPSRASYNIDISFSIS